MTCSIYCFPRFSLRLFLLVGALLGQLARSQLPSQYYYSAASSSSGQDIVIVVNGGPIYVSNDFGVDWFASSTSLTVADWFSVACSSSGQYMAAVRYNSGIYVSTDYGSTFSDTSAPSSFFWWVSMDSTGQYIGAVVQNGKAYLSSDYGSSWALLSGIPTAKWCTIWLSPNHDRMVAGSSGSGIYYSSDFGQTWLVASNVSSSYTWVCATSNSSGLQLYISGWSGDVLSSSNGGASWTTIISNVSSWSSIASDSTGTRLVLAEYDGGIYLSADSGNTWTLSTAPNPSQWISVTSSSTGQYLVGAIYQGDVYLSSNYGLSWSRTVTLPPSIAPSSAPSDSFSCSPSVGPSYSPSSFLPSAVPSCLPTTSTNSLSLFPTAAPSTLQTIFSSPLPTIYPSYTPSSEPTIVPTIPASLMPTIQPSLCPSTSPSLFSSTPSSTSSSYTPTLVLSFAPITLSPFMPISSSSSPSYQPTSCAPSESPSQSFPPSSSVPSSSPIVNPFYLPTVSPSIILEFYVFQILSGTNLTSWTNNFTLYEYTLQLSISQCMQGIYYYDIIDLVPIVNTTTSPVQQIALASSSSSSSMVNITYRVTSSNISLSYNSLSSQLKSAVDTDSFTYFLQNNAKQLDAQGLLNATSNYVQTAPYFSPTVFPTSSVPINGDDHGLSPAVYLIPNLLTVAVTVISLAVSFTALHLRRAKGDLLGSLRPRLVEWADAALKCGLLAFTSYQLLEQLLFPQSSAAYGILLLVARVVPLIALGEFFYEMTRKEVKGADNRENRENRESDRIPLLLLFDETSVSSGFQRAVYSLLLAFSALDCTLLRLLPWLRTTMTDICQGFPSPQLLRSAVLSSLTAQVVQAAASILLLVTDKLSIGGGGDRGRVYSFCLVLCILVNALRNIAAAVLTELILNKDESSLVVLERRDVMQLRRALQLSNSRGSSSVFDETFYAEAKGAVLLDSVSTSDNPTGKIMVEQLRKDVANERTDTVEVQSPLASTFPPVGEGQFLTSLPYAEQTFEIMKQQLRARGELPIEYIPLDQLQAEINELIAKGTAGGGGVSQDENRLEYLLRCLDYHPDYLRKKQEELSAWRVESREFLSSSLAIQRSFVPPQIFKSSLSDLLASGLTKPLAQRILAKKCLWLLRLREYDIQRMHIAELTGRFNYEGVGLDLVEGAALLAALPTEFRNDGDGKKGLWRAYLEQTIRKMMGDDERGTLIPQKKRHNVYLNCNSGPFEGRESFHNLHIISGEDAFKPRDSFKALSKRTILQKEKSNLLGEKGNNISSQNNLGHSDELLDIETGEISAARDSSGRSSFFPASSSVSTRGTILQPGKLNTNNDFNNRLSGLFGQRKKKNLTGGSISTGISL